MSRRRPSGAKNVDSPAKFWVQLEHWLLNCPAYTTLSSNAKVLYTEVKRRYNGRNNGLITISAREAGAAINATHHTGARALLELQEHGFLVITEQSNFNRKVHLSRQYRLTEVADDREGFKAPATKDFIRWSPVAGLKSKTQSHPCDTTVAPMRHHLRVSVEKQPNSSTHATVGTTMAGQQSHPCDTYRLSAIPTAAPEVAQGVAEEAPVHTGRARRSDEQAAGSVQDLPPRSGRLVQVSETLVGLLATANGGRASHG